MFLAILSICTDEELDSSGEESDSEEEARLSRIARGVDSEEAEARKAAETRERKERMRSKVLAVGRMARAFKLLRFVIHIPYSPLLCGC